MIAKMPDKFLDQDLVTWLPGDIKVIIFGGYSVIKQKVFERYLSRARNAWKFDYKTLNFPRKKLSNVLKFDYKTTT